MAHLNGLGKRGPVFASSPRAVIFKEAKPQHFHQEPREQFCGFFVWSGPEKMPANGPRIAQDASE